MDSPSMALVYHQLHAAPERIQFLISWFLFSQKFKFIRMPKRGIQITCLMMYEHFCMHFSDRCRRIKRTHKFRTSNTFVVNTYKIVHFEVFFPLLHSVLASEFEIFVHFVLLHLNLCSCFFFLYLTIGSNGRRFYLHITIYCLFKYDR